MKLYDIELALKNLIHINQDLDEVRLQTLLEAAGWADGDVKDAILLWRNHPKGDFDDESSSVEIVTREPIVPSEVLSSLPATMKEERPEFSVVKKEENKSHNTGKVNEEVKK